MKTSAQAADAAVEGQFTRSYELRHDELGPNHHFQPSVLLGVLQEAAIDGSAHRGFPLSYYQQARTFWMLRRITFRYERPLRHGESFSVTTWVSRVGKTSPTREYRIESASHRECIARVRTYWVYIDLATGRSKEIPEELRRGFAPTDESLEPILDVPSGPLDPSRAREPVLHSATLGDIDWSNHVKCCRYVAWLETLFGQAHVEAGERPGQTSVASFDLQLLAATKAGDSVQLTAQPGHTWKVDLCTPDGAPVARAALWPSSRAFAQTS